MDSEPELPPPPKPISPFGKVYGLLRERWPEYVLEVIVIIFSITISFAFDEWKDGRQKKELEQIYLKGLYNDIKTDVGQLNEVIAETRQVVQKAKALSEFDEQTPMVDNSQFLTDVRFVFKRPRFVAEDATFSDLKSTGNMQVISSFPLKNSLFEYYRQYAATGQVEAAELDATTSIIGPYILTRLPMTGKATNTRSTALAGDMAFQNMMMVRRSTREELLGDYEESLKLGDEILALIKVQLK